MPLSPQEVASKVFGPTRMRRGYDENEVDAFLDVVEAELTRLTTENERLRRELVAAGRSLPDLEEAPPVGKHAAPVESSGSTPPAAIAAATPAAVEATSSSIFEKAPNPVANPAPAVDEAPVEQRVTRMLVLAQQTADAAIQEAQTDAERTRAAARADAERVISEARSRAAEELGSLERNKTLLEGEVEQLQTFEREYRQRLRAYLSMQLSQLEHDPSAPAAVEGTTDGADPHRVLDVSGAAGDGQSDPDPLTVGLSDPPGFGAVWSPGAGGDVDPAIGAPRDPAGQG